MNETNEQPGRAKVADGMRRMAGALHRIADAAEDGSNTGVEAIAKTLVLLQQVQADLVGAAKEGADEAPSFAGNRFDRFTDRAREIMQLARRESVRLQHSYVGTEHLLLGMIEEKRGVAAQVLRTFEVDLAKVREGVNKIVQGGPVETTVTIDQMLPFTPRAKAVLEASVAEARKLLHDYVGTEHMLLGLLVVEEGVAAQVLQQILPPGQPGTADGGTTKDAVSQLDVVRAEVLELLGAGQAGGPALTAERVQALLNDALGVKPCARAVPRDPELVALCRAWLTVHQESSYEKTEAEWQEWWKQRDHPTADLQAVLDPLTHGSVLVRNVMEAVEDMVRSGFHAGAGHRSDS